jgi:KDO2-lipid IV(A) lauroyltransferase
MRVCDAIGHDAAVKLGVLAARIIRKFSPRRTARACSRCSRMLGVPDDRAESIIREAYAHFGRALVEFIRLPREYQRLDDMITVQGEENLRKALELGHGAILLSAHIGCWEYAAAVLAKHGIPMNAIGAEQRDERITQAIASLRASAGVKPVGKGIDLRAAVECIRRNEVLAVLLDQDAKSAGVLSPFLGTLASTPVGPVKLARKFGTPILPGHIVRDEDASHMTFVIEPPLRGIGGQPFGNDVQHAVDLCNEAISRWIRATPGQWLWMYPRWESTLNDR